MLRDLSKTFTTGRWRPCCVDLPAGINIELQQCRHSADLSNTTLRLTLHQIILMLTILLGNSSKEELGLDFYLINDIESCKGTDIMQFYPSSGLDSCDIIANNLCGPTSRISPPKCRSVSEGRARCPASVSCRAARRCGSPHQPPAPD